MSCNARTWGDRRSVKNKKFWEELSCCWSSLAQPVLFRVPLKSMIILLTLLRNVVKCWLVFKRWSPIKSNHFPSTGEVIEWICNNILHRQISVQSGLTFRVTFTLGLPVYCQSFVGAEPLVDHHQGLSFLERNAHCNSPSITSSLTTGWVTSYECCRSKSNREGALVTLDVCVTLQPGS